LQVRQYNAKLECFAYILPTIDDRSRATAPNPDVGKMTLTYLCVTNCLSTPKNFGAVAL